MKRTNYIIILFALMIPILANGEGLFQTSDAYLSSSYSRSSYHSSGAIGTIGSTQPMTISSGSGITQYNSSYSGSGSKYQATLSSIGATEVYSNNLAIRRSGKTGGQGTEIEDGKDVKTPEVHQPLGDGLWVLLLLSIVFAAYTAIYRRKQRVAALRGN